MKKALLCFLILTFTLALTLTSCSHEHEWGKWETVQAATCTEKGTKIHRCSCGKTETETIDFTHSWDNNICGKEQTCTLCQKKQINPQRHALNYTYDKCKYCNIDIVSISVPQTPLEISRIIYDTNNKVLANTFKIEELSYAFTNNTVTFIMSGTQIYSIYGEDYLSANRISYKLYDEDNYVIASGTIETIKIAPGDSIRNIEFTIGQIEKWGSYRLELFNAYN